MCSGVSLIFHSQNVWQAWHDRDCPFRQDKTEEDGDERKKPSAHQREWVSPVSVCFWTLLKPWSPATIFLSVAARRLQRCQKTTCSASRAAKKTNCCSISTSRYTAHLKAASASRLRWTQTRWPKLSPPFLFQPSSKRGKAMPHLDFWAHEEKKLRCHSKKHFLLIITVFQSLMLSSDKGALELPGVP